MKPQTGTELPSPSATAKRFAVEPSCPVRGIYFATHFGNWYVNAPVEDVCAYIEDLARRGTNHLMLWFDLSNFYNLEAPGAQKLLARMRQFAATAHAAGMRVGLIRVANESWQNSPPELRVDVKGGRGAIMLSDVCPSIPAARELIERTSTEIFGLFEHLDFICLWPYDSGSCGCAKCQPWGSAGFLVAGEIVARQFRRHFPDGHVILSTWFMDQNEWTLLRAKIEAGEVGWIDSLMAEPMATWTQGTCLQELFTGDVPRNLPLLGFPEISMEAMSPWGGCGATPRPESIRERWEKFGGHVAGGFPYSEGMYEDVNKAIYTGLYRQRDRSVDDILREYVATEFSPAVVEEGVEMLKLMETTHKRHDLKVHNLDAAERIWQLASKIHQSLRPEVAAHWRWQILYLRARIDALLKAERPVEELRPVLAELHALYHTDEMTLLGWLLPPLPPQRVARDPGNLAAGKPVTVSSGSGEALVDEVVSAFDPDNFWSSANTDPTPSVIIDLERTPSIADVQLQFRPRFDRWYKYYGAPTWVTVEVSVDGRVYEPVIQQSRDVPLDDQIYKQWFYSYPVGRTARYVKLSFGVSKIGCVQLSEVRIH